MSIAVLAILTGKVDQAFSPEEGSAIAKQAASGPLELTLAGFAGDEQADKVHHGGRDMAVHHYPAEHYGYWRSLMGEHPLLAHAGAFGENVSTAGLTEDAVCIGDRYRLGTALVEVSQGRKPCWKQGRRLGDPQIVSRMVRQRFSGWYYRVIVPGRVAAGDAMALTARVAPEWTVERVFALLIAGEGKHDPAALRALARLEVLSENWREKAASIAEGLGKP